MSFGSLRSAWEPVKCSGSQPLSNFSHLFHLPVHLSGPLREQSVSREHGLFISFPGRAIRFILDSLKSSFCAVLQVAAENSPHLSIAMDASHKLNAGWLWQSIAKDKEILTSIVCTTVKSKLITFSHDCRHRSKLACVVLALDQANNLCRLSKKQLSRFPLHSSSIITSSLDFSLYHGHISLKQHL